MNDRITQTIAQVAHGKTRDELEAFARRLELGAKRARTEADAASTDEERADLLGQSDRMNFAADELFAHAQSAAPVRTLRLKPNRPVSKLAIYLGSRFEADTDELPPTERPWCVSVMSKHGTNHFNDFPTRDEALIYIESLRPNWPDLPVIEIV